MIERIRLSSPNIEAVGTMMGLGNEVFYREGDKESAVTVPAILVDSTMFSVFPFEWVEGSAREFTAAGTAVINEAFAEMFFGDESAIGKIRIVTIDPRGSTVHWRITEESGRQVVLEIVNKQPTFHENSLGVLTNSPTFDWHLTNLNNYVNLTSGPVQDRKIGDLTLKSFGGGSGLHGIPGDMTPPSRFVRAAIFQATAPKMPTAEKTVEQAFHILNNFDIPTGIQFAEGQPVPDIPSATQWTVVTDIANRRIYYRTMYNSNIRCIDLKAIDFLRVEKQSAPLDYTKRQPIEHISVR